MKLKIIRAGAGSGKTQQLMEELVKAITRKKDPARPQAVVMTSFTRNAAAELVDRAASKLIDENLIAEAAALRQARTGTVHSVCQSLIQEFAFEAGVSPSLSVLDEGPAATLLKTSISTALTEAEFLELSGLDRKFSNKAPTRYSVDNRYPVQILEIINKARANGITADMLPAWAEYSEKTVFRSAASSLGFVQFKKLASKVDAALNRLGPPGTLYDATEKVRSRIRRILNDEWAWDDIAAWSKNGMAKTDCKKLDEAEATAFETLASHASGHASWPEFRKDVMRYQELCFNAASKVMQTYSETKRKRKEVDFNDLEAYALELLGKKEICERLDGRIDLLLVDEFQDTSPIQLAIFLKLAGIARETIWVGDPKQSIFGFRDTDLRLMLEAEKSLDPDRETLDCSYRSCPELVKASNKIFSEAFKTMGMTEDEIKLKAHRKDSGQKPALQRWLTSGKGTITDGAQETANKIAEVLSAPGSWKINIKGEEGRRPIRPADIAVLSYSNANCDTMVSALRAAGVPVSRPEVGLLALPIAQLVTFGLRIVSDPGNTLASAYVSYCLDVLLGSGSDVEWLENRIKENQEQEKLPVGDKEKYGAWNSHPVVLALRAWAKDHSSASPLEALDAVMSLTGVHKLAASDQNDPREAASCLDSLRSYASAWAEEAIRTPAPLTIAGLCREFDRIAKDKEDTIPASPGDSVTVTTFHKAKGLEWPMVIIWPLKKVDYSPIYGVSAVQKGTIDIKNPLKGRGILFVPCPYGKGSGTASFDEALKELPEYKTAALFKGQEHLRVIYVVFTRARDYLVFANGPGQNSLLLSRETGAEIVKVPMDIAVSETGWEVTNISGLVAPVFKTSGRLPWFPYKDLSEKSVAEATPSGLFIEADEARKLGVSCSSGEEFSEKRMQKPSDVDERVFGTALHSYLAVDTSRMDRPKCIEIAKRILKSHDIDEGLADGFVDRGKEIFDWVAKKWPDAILHREWPISFEEQEVQFIGNVDLVVETESDFAIVDFKSFPGKKSEIEDKALSYSPQLAAYAEAVKKALSKACKGTYVCFSSLGVSAKVDIKNCTNTVDKVIKK